MNDIAHNPVNAFSNHIRMIAVTNTDWFYYRFV
jgi:hypothetical protein